MEREETSTLAAAIRHTFKEWCLKTTSHGIPHIMMTKNWIIRLMWLLFFLASVAYCIFIIIKTTVKYSKFDTKISIEIIDELPAEFPAVTICNVNAFNEAKAKDYLKKTKIAEDLLVYQCIDQEGAEFSKCLNSNDKTLEILDVLVDELKRYVANDRSIDSNRSYYGFDLNSEMLISCLYNDKACGATNFTPSWNNEYGNCYTFNDRDRGKVPVKISDTGIKYGLKMELVVNPPNNETVFSYKNGLYVLVHNSTSKPFSLSSAIYVPTGFETYVGVSRTRRTVLESPYSDCVSQLKSFSTYSERLFKYFRDLNVTYYDQDFCYSLCFQDQLNDACSCIDTVTPRIANANYCVKDSAYCMFDFKEQFFKADIYALCEGACPQQCERTEYNLVTSMATFPTMSYLRFLQSNQFTKRYFPQEDTNLEKFGRNSFLKLIINYDRLYYTMIKDSPDQKFEDYLGSLGGQLGLFIGISFLSLLELVELTIELVVVCLQYE